MLPYFENRPEAYYSFTWRDQKTWPIHLHDNVEIVCVLRGSIDLIIDFTTYSLRAGDAAVIFPHTVHGYQTPKKIETTLFKGAMLIPPKGGWAAEDLARFSPSSPVIRAAEINEETRYALDRLLRADPDNPRIAQAYLHLFLGLAWPLLKAEPLSNANGSNTPRRVIEYVIAHYRQPLQAKDVADALGISRSHLARLFTQHFHMNFNEYVNRLRVQQAQEMLRTTDRPVTDVMLEVGFDSQSTFNRVFRQYRGLSPREYRQLHRHPDGKKEAR
ncbi:MAG: helix-turn-helix domain-containing protein [Acutalibacteraceae bacterium]|jgi:AraC-like DNA-binding protein